MRVRFAPSPTGYLHIGNARTAVVNYITAKKHNAEFILRVEDTDLERSTKESEISIMDDLKWLGINWTEGPDLGGNYGPYRQSERFEIYKKYTQKLLEEGKAYHCYCTKEELEEDRKDADGNVKSFEYSGKCRALTQEDKKKFEAEGRKPTVRFHVPNDKNITFDDTLKGTVNFNSNNIGGDFIIVRSDGVPVYNYIVIVDDSLMNVTHVIRGEDHLSNTPKQILLAEALEFAIPQYAHLPLIVGDDRAKLSKRHGITSVNLYRSEGYLPQTLFNYLGMLGWASESENELMTFDELLKEFDMNNLGKSAAIFDFQKLKWINNNYIKQLTKEKVLELFTPYLESANYKIDLLPKEKAESICELLKPNCDLLSDIVKFIGIFLDETVIPDEEASEMLKEEYSKPILQAAKEILDEGINETNCLNAIELIKDKSGNTGKKLFMPLRALITGRLKGPDLHQALPLIGPEKLTQRFTHCVKKFL
jgi:nondiscriminating glutamyl-tRNA synthetase